MSDILMTVVEAAAFLGVSRSSFRRHNAGNIPRVKIGQRIVRYRLSDLERYRDSLVEQVAK